MAVVRYKVLPKQRLFLQACQEVPYTAYIGGFGSGKTHILTIQALIEAQCPGSLGLVGAPTYRLLQDTTQRKFFELCPQQWIYTFSKSENRVVLTNGTEIMFRSLDNPEQLTNLGLSWFGLDEIGVIDVEVYRMLQGRMRRPGGSHHGFGVGNPAGPTHWTYEYFVDKAVQRPDLYRLISAPSYENSFLPPGYIENMEVSYGTDSLYYRRYVLGEFVSFEGAYYANFDLRRYPEGQVCEMQDIDKILSPQRYTGCVIDFGYEHPFVCLWYVTDGETIVFHNEYYKRHATLHEHALQIQRIAREDSREYNFSAPTFAWTDHDAQTRAELEADPKAPIACSPADKLDRIEGILQVQGLIGARRLFVTTRCPQTLKEIPSYRAKPLDKNKSGVEQPLKEKDDCVDCIRMAVQSEFRRWGKFGSYGLRPVTSSSAQQMDSPEVVFQRLPEIDPLRIRLADGNS